MDRSEPSPKPGGLASFIPVALAQRLSVGPPRPWHESRDAAVLVADITGSSGMAADLVSAVDIEELGGSLNRAVEPLVDAVADFGGDILSFTGDGLVASWPVESVASAVAGGLSAQEQLRRSRSPIGVRIGVSVGPLELWSVGGEAGRWLFVPGGEAVVAASRLQADAPSGAVAVGAEVASRLGGGARVEPLERSDGAHPAFVVRSVPAVRAADPSAGPRLAGEVSDQALGAYIPETVSGHVVAGLDAYLAEMRTISAVFVRRRGHDPAAGIDSMQPFVRLLQRTVDRYGCALTSLGVDQAGSAALIVAGLPPHAHEDDAERSLLVARDLLVNRGGPEMPLGVGIGVGRGRALCGPMGTRHRREYTVVGDVVNVAAHLAAAACGGRGDGLLCDEATAAGARSRLRPVPPISVRLKGRDELMTVYSPRVERRQPRPGGPGVAMVGRQAELAALEDLERARPSGHGSLVLVVAEAGMGKSRLLGELEAGLARLGRRVVRGYGDGLETGRAYLPWRPVFEALLEVDGLAPAEAAARLRQSMGADADAIGPLLGWSPVADGGDGLSVEQRVARTVEAGLRCLREARGTAPLTVLLEDGHWFDSGSWTLVGEAAAIEGILVVCTARPPGAGRGGPPPRLLDRPGTRTIHLEPLSRPDVERLLTQVLGVAGATPQLCSLVEERCSGNPFFITEVVGSLTDQGAISTVDDVAGLARHLVDVEVPSTIGGALTARMDALTPGQQLVLKVASVAGSSMGVAELELLAPTGRPEALATELAALGRTGLMQTDGTSVSFPHVLVRDCAYQLLMPEQRRSLHCRLARLYEAEDGAAPALLAHHWRLGGDSVQAVRNLRAATTQDLALGMLHEAVGHAVGAAEQLGVELGYDRADIAPLVGAAMAEIDTLMAGRRPADLRDLPELVDDRVAEAIAVIFEAMPAAFQSLQPELFALMALRCLSLTLRFGAGPLAPGVYSMQSIVMRAMDPDGSDAFELSELALAMVPAPTPLSSAVKFIHAWFHVHWARPFIEGVGLSEEAADEGFATGNTLYGSFGAGSAVTFAAAAGHRLESVMARGRSGAQRIGGQSVAARFHAQLETQVAKALAGRTPSLVSLSDDWCDEAELAAMVGTDNLNQAAYYHVAKLRLGYLAGDDAMARHHAAAAQGLLGAFRGQVAEIDLVTFRTLLALRDGLGVSAEATERAGADLARMEAWARRCPDNFAYRHLLGRAELARCEGRDTQACDTYGAAVASAGTFDQPMWAGLAAQRAARHASAHDPALASSWRAEAGRHYREAGAARLIEQLGGTNPGGS